MNEKSENNSIVVDAFKAASACAAIAYGVKNRKRIFTKDNLEVITDAMEAKSFEKAKNLAIKENSLLKNVKMNETRRSILKPGYSASSNGNINNMNKITRTPGLAFLRITNDEVYKSASKVAGRPATNSDIMDWIMAHEFGHQDHFTKNINYDVNNTELKIKSKLNRSAYKQTPYEMHADEFAKKILAQK